MTHSSEKILEFKKTPDNPMKKAKAKAIEAIQKNSALLAIRAKCLDCACGSNSEIRKCTLTHCALHPFRMGKRPSSKSRPTKRAA
jgi:hypothetical protein